VRLVGINYKDTPENARRFLTRFGNPFAAIGVDGGGRAAIEWGVYGVPETFIVGRDGRIAFKRVGPIDEHSLKALVLPAVEKALSQ
jgi:cytochrome c biogenesis protein CcmG/thiol:disulfide interchange protein DsbE